MHVACVASAFISSNSPDAFTAASVSSWSVKDKNMGTQKSEVDKDSFGLYVQVDVRTAI